MDLYHTKRWKAKRNKILRRDGYQSQLALRYGKHVQGETVHHIFPRDKYPEYQWQDWNLITLSIKEHNRMHDRNTGELSEEGKALQERTAREQGIEI